MKAFASSPSDNPEFDRVPGISRRFGMGKSYIYTLIEEGVIKSVSVRRRGCTKGIRLVSVDSVRQFLNSQMTAA